MSRYIKTDTWQRTSYPGEGESLEVFNSEGAYYYSFEGLCSYICV